jgi:hypothetical protein
MGRRTGGDQHRRHDLAQPRHMDAAHHEQRAGQLDGQGAECAVDRFIVRRGACIDRATEHHADVRSLSGRLRRDGWTREHERKPGRYGGEQQAPQGATIRTQHAGGAP